MYLPAISLGYAVPKENFAAMIHSAFRSALNLRLEEEKYLLTLVVSDESDLPQGIRVDTPENFSFETFQVGEAAVCRDGILHFEKSSLTVQLSQARRWKCDLPEVGRTGSPTYLLAAWNFVWETLNERQRLSEAEILAEELLHGSARARMPRKAGEAMHKLVDATRRNDLNISAVRALIGLGSGLTPSGDDLLVGYLAGLWCTVLGKNERAQFIADLGKAVLQLSSKTNDISRTYLYHATQGQVSSRLADLAEAISHGTNINHLSEVAETAFKVGHTSGMDAVTGLLFGMAVWTNLGTFK